MHAYLVGTLKPIECPSRIVRSVEDHLHCLVQLSRTVTIAKLVETMKVESSSWLKRQEASLLDFHWQPGYGAFSVSQSNIEAVKSYVTNQEDHHRRISFQDEFRVLPRRHEREFDERYVWD